MRVAGKVIKGNGIGRKLGFPTVNLEVEEKSFSLDSGVYGVWVWLEDGSRWRGALHFGPKGGVEVSCFEVYILDFDGDLYGQIVEVEIGEKLRDVKRFSTELDLKSQITKDVEKVRGLGYSKFWN